MRFMMIVKADKDTEAGVLPRKADLEAMGKYDEELQKAGVLVDGVGLQASSKGARVAFVDGQPQVTDGPFPETKELIAGFWMLDVKSKAEAVEWAKKVPFRHLPGSGRVPELELRQVFGEDDLAGVK
jgi:hypothetical protein